MSAININSAEIVLIGLEDWRHGPGHIRYVMTQQVDCKNNSQTFIGIIGQPNCKSRPKFMQLVEPVLRWTGKNSNIPYIGVKTKITISVSSL